MDCGALALCLLDFVPNLAFLAGAVCLIVAARRVAGTSCARWLLAGAFFVFAGGAMKALWKLLTTLGLTAPLLLSNAQFVLMAPGFAMLLIGVLLWLRSERLQGTARPAPTLLAMAVWKMPLVAIMALSSMGFHVILSFLAFRRKARLAGVLFIVALLALLAMSGMASGEQSVARQWIEEGVNSGGQIAFAVGSYQVLCRCADACGEVANG